MTAVDRLAGVVGHAALKPPCRVKTTADITLSGTQTIDGVAVAANDRVLVANQDTASENGIYVVSANAWERAADFDGRRDIVKGTLIRVIEGTLGGSNFYEVTTTDPIIGNTDIDIGLTTVENGLSMLTQNELNTILTVAGDAVITGKMTSATAEIGDPGDESSGIDINGTTYTAGLRVNDIGGEHPAEVVFHRHSTTLQPLLVGARSNSNDETHAAVTTGQSLFTIFGAGFTSGHYDLFGSLDLQVGSGTVSGTSSPGKYVISLSPDGSNTPESVVTFDSDKSATFAGAVIMPNVYGDVDFYDPTGATLRAEVVSTGFKVPDSQAFYAGTGNDAYFWHNGTNTNLTNLTGTMVVRESVNSGLLQLDSKDSVGTLKTGVLVGGATPAVSLYYDGGVELSTTANGIKINNDTTFLIYYGSGLGGPVYQFDTNDYMYYARATDRYHFMIGAVETCRISSDRIIVPDNNYIVAGTGSDFYMQHAGTASILQNVTGNLIIREAVNSGLLYLRANDSVGTNNIGFHIGGATTTFNGYYDGNVVLTGRNGGVIIGNDPNFNLNLSTNPYIHFDGGGDWLLYSRATDQFLMQIAMASKLGVDNTSTAGDTALLVYDVDNATLERVTVGAADSGGTGYKVLRIPN